MDRSKLTNAFFPRNIVMIKMEALSDEQNNNLFVKIRPSEFLSQLGSKHAAVREPTQTEAKSTKTDGSFDSTENTLLAISSSMNKEPQLDIYVEGSLRDGFLKLTCKSGK